MSMNGESIDLGPESMEPVRAEDIVEAEALVDASRGFLARNSAGNVAKGLLDSLQRIQRTGRPVTGEVLCSPDPIEAIRRILVNVLDNPSWKRVGFESQSEAEQAIREVPAKEAAEKAAAEKVVADAEKAATGEKVTEDGNGNGKRGKREKKERGGGIFRATVMQVVEKGTAALARNDVSGGKTVIVYFEGKTGLQRGASLTLVLDPKGRKDAHEHPIATIWTPPVEE